MLFTICHDAFMRFFVWLEARFQHNESCYCFTTIFMWNAYNGSLCYSLVTIQHLFYLTRIDIEAAGDDQVFGTIYNIEITILVHFADITGTQPAIDENVSGLCFAVPIATHDVGTLD